MRGSRMSFRVSHDVKMLPRAGDGRKMLLI